MTYEETIDYLFHATPVFENVGASAYKEGLTNTLALDEHFNHPHRQYKTIHVAGTNGKGSCSHTLASILQAEGYKVGLYTSPHLIDFRERIRVNGQCIDQERVIRFVEEERSFFEPLHPSFFELTTALAFTYFAEQKVDVAVIEVGLGGRLDCTNIITPILSIITNISLDHTQFLGNTLSLIAKEKAGIIKNRIPVVVGETTAETKNVFEEVANQHEAPLIFAEDNNEIIASRYDNALQERIYKTQSFGEIHGDLMGNYQDKNANTVLNAVKVLKNNNLIKLSDNSVRQGFKQVSSTTGLLGRWQCIQKSPATYCDTGHNVG
ncbi:MAG: bifunctional folylpolyglutamate synthase/dihydrofolate synthase, partial [Hoylesella buccalis]